jgi:hypothetical protein
MNERNQQKLREIDDLGEWCFFVHRFVHAHVSPIRAPENRKTFEEEYQSLIEGWRRGKERGNLQGARAAYRDTNEMARDLGEPLRGNLDRALRERFGHGLERGDRQLARQARAILKRGKIFTGEQYRILETRLSALIEDQAGANEVAEINALLMTVKDPLPD